MFDDKIYYLHELELLDEGMFLYEGEEFDYIERLVSENKNNNEVFKEFKNRCNSSKSTVLGGVSDSYERGVNKNFTQIYKINVEIFNIKSQKLSVGDLLDLYNENKATQEPYFLLFKFELNDDEFSDDVLYDLQEWADSSLNIKKHKTDPQELLKFLPKKSFKFLCNGYTMDLSNCSFIQYGNNKKTFCVLVDRCEFYR